MFKNLKITNNFKCNGNLKFQNFSLLEGLLKNKSFKGNNYISSKILGKNQSVLLKESPFHYPVAKKVLNNSSRDLSIISNYNVNVTFSIKKLKYSTILKIVDSDYGNINSLYTPKSTITSLFIDYTPKL